MKADYEKAVEIIYNIEKSWYQNQQNLYSYYLLF
jgi:hypothetical protein